jgi:hypothetical protein
VLPLSKTLISYFNDGGLSRLPINEMAYGMILLLFLLAQTLWLPCLAESGKAELVLFQTHGDSGPQVVHLTTNAIHILNKNGGYEILAKAPDWGVSLFRRDDKRVYSTSFAGFHAFSTYGPLEHFTGSQSFRRISTERKQDLQLTKYAKSVGSDIRLIENFKVAPQIGEIFEIYYRAPVAGIPFDHNMRTRPNKDKDKNKKTFNRALPPDPVDQVMLSTQKWQFLPAVNSNDFVCPKGLKPVKTQSEVLLSDQKKVEFDSILEDMGVGKKLGN